MNRALFLLALVLQSCAHSSRIISVPAGAEISVDGKKMGTAPLLLDERSGTPGRTRVVRADLPGQPPILRTQSVKLCTNPANIIMDVLLIGFAFGFCHGDETILDFTAAPPRATPSPKAPQAIP